MQIHLFDQKGDLNDFLHNSFDIFVDIDDIGFDLLDDFNFSRHLNDLRVPIKFINLGYLLHNGDDLLQHNRHFFDLLDYALNLNNLLLYHSELFIPSLHHYLLSINYLHLRLDIRDLMDNVHLFYPDHLLDLRHYHLVFLQLRQEAYRLMDYRYGQILLQNYWDRYFHRMDDNVVRLYHLYVVDIHVLYSISEDFHRLLFCLDNHTLIDYLMRHLNRPCLDVLHKYLLLDYLLLLDCKVDDSFHWDLHRYFADAGHLNYSFDWGQLFGNLDYLLNDPLYKLGY